VERVLRGVRRETTLLTRTRSSEQWPPHQLAGPPTTHTTPSLDRDREAELIGASPEHCPGEESERPAPPPRRIRRGPPGPLRSHPR
jgi:hypothetical protein